jgi:Ca2+-dependent lipid-binding protein
MPMIEVIVNENEQIEHTKTIQPPLNMNPVWKEILPFDILRPTDEVAI